MTAATVLNAGDYDLLVDVGYPIDAFTLDDSTRGLLDSTDFVLDGSTSFASVIDGTKSIKVKRGRQSETDAVATGTMSFVLDDTRAGGVFNPFDDSPSNPYYDQTGNVPGLAPGREVKLVRYDNTNAEELLFVGTVVDYDLTFSVGALTDVVVLCADFNYKLANTFISAHTPSVELSGARIGAILNRAEVDYPTGTARDISTGTVNLGDYPIAEGTNVKAYFDQITATAERGRIYLSRDGVLTATNRIGSTISGPSVVFSDDGTQTPYNDLDIVFDADQLINRVTVTPVGGTTETAVDTDSIDKYFTKALDISNSLLDTQGDASALASYLLKPEPSPRFTAVEVFFGSLTTAQKDAVAIVDIGDTIEITRAIQTGNTTTTITQELQVEGVEHTLTAGRGHTTRLYTSPTDIVTLLILDVGNLDEEVLG
jgi:hypothetical protein